MTTPEQMEKMLKLLEVQQQQQQQMQEQMMKQMETLTVLQTENTALRNAATADNNNNSNNGVGEQRYKPKRFNRPVIERDIDDREWALLMDTWGRYKDMCKFAEGDTASIRSELRAACSDDVNKLLFEFVGASVLNECTEEQLLGHIKAVAVKHTHKEVHRMGFDQLVQGDGESVIQYVARLKSKAFLCQFDIECCACHSQERQSYAEDMIATRLTSGLRNQEHKRKVLAEAETLTTLDAKVQRLQVLEMTDLSASALHTPLAEPSAAAAGKSQYKKWKSDSSDGDSSLIRCKFCGKTAHPNGKSLERIHCPARTKMCFRCKKKGHIGVVCESSQVNAGIEEGSPETVPLASESLVSFAFGTEEDFRLSNKKNVNS